MIRLQTGKLIDDKNCLTKHGVSWKVAPHLRAVQVTSAHWTRSESNSGKCQDAAHSEQATDAVGW